MTRTLLPAAGLLALAALALVGQVVLALLGHASLPVLDSVLLAGLTGGAAVTQVLPAPAPRTPPDAQ